MKKIIIIILGLAVAYGSWYFISPLFITIEVDEALPENLVTHTQQTTQVDEVKSVGQEIDSDTKELIGFEAPVEVVEKSLGSPVVGTAGHRASGVVQVLETNDGSVIRYEDFETINGPNLHVYLTNDLDARDYVDLGPIKGTKGNINYEVPENINLEDYKYVTYWCVPFGVLFNYAEI
jgi:hypothetical protein